MISYRHTFEKEVRDDMAQTGCGFKESWAKIRSLSPNLFAAMEAEGDPVREKMANEAATSGRSTLTPIIGGPSEIDSLISDWAYEAVSAGSKTLASFRAALQNGSGKLTEGQAHTLRTHIATSYEKKAGCLRTEAWGKLRVLLPELFSDDSVVQFGTILTMPTPGQERTMASAHIPPDRYWFTLFPQWLKEALTLDGSQSDVEIDRLLRTNSRTLTKDQARRAINAIVEGLAGRERISQDMAETRLRSGMPQLFRLAGM